MGRKAPKQGLDPTSLGKIRKAGKTRQSKKNKYGVRGAGRKN